MSITRINEFEAVSGKEEEMHTFLKSLIPYISNSKGCDSCEVLRLVDNTSICVVIEKWDTLDSHKKSIENFPKAEMADAMSLFAAPPKSASYQDS
ncbi:MAG: antibiotic biosynthesis monooxygenase [Reichenbachiella sp.]